MTDTRKLIDPRLPRGFEDRLPGEIAAVDQMIAKIKAVYERYGFDPLETPLFEYTETLGKFLPDTDRPNAGVFSLMDDDEQWMSLRYDLTAPLARYFAENYERLPKPFRSYRQGYVFRNEKPGPGRFRQFTQFDADTVGAAGPEADAEMCMMMADTMDALGLAGKYVVKVNSRKVLDGLMEAVGLGGEHNSHRRLAVMRAIDKFDKFGFEGVRLLLGRGRKDESGDFTKGAELTDIQAAKIMVLFEVPAMADEAVAATRMPGAMHGAGPDDIRTFENVRADAVFGGMSVDAVKTSQGLNGLSELRTIWGLVNAGGYNDGRIRIDPSVVRGLEYYTGPVFEIELTFEVKNEKGQPVVFGSVGGGGRYDGLVSRFRHDATPATGFSIGVSRLAQALKLTGNLDASALTGPVVVLVMDRDQTARYQEIVSRLRNAGIRAEMFLGATKNFGKQVAYADKRNSPAVIIEGTQERATGKVQIKDLIVGKQEAAAIKDNATYKSERPGQFECDGDLDAIVKAVSELPAVKVWLKSQR